MENYKVLKLLEKTTRCSTYFCRRLQNPNQLYCMSIQAEKYCIPTYYKDGTNKTNALRQRVQHPFLQHFYSFFKLPYYYIYISEYVPEGDFQYQLKTSGKMSETAAVFYASQVALAFEYLHANKIIFCGFNLKSAFIGLDGYLKIGEFHYAREDLDDTNQIPYRDVAIEYICTAPEETDNPDGGYGREFDWWTLGIFVYQLLCGHDSDPFERKCQVVEDVNKCSIRHSRKSKNEPISFDQTFESIHEIVDAVLRTIFDCPNMATLSFPSHISPLAKDFVSQLLQREPTQRLGTGPLGGINVRNHQFFQDNDFVKLYAKEIVPPYEPSHRIPENVVNFQQNCSELDDGFEDEDDVLFPIPLGTLEEIAEKYMLTGEILPDDFSLF